MAIKPSISVSLNQKSAPKVLMRQLIKLLPLNDTELEEVIKKEMQENPFLQFNETNLEYNDVADFNIDEAKINTPSIYKILTPQIEATFTNKNEFKIAMELLSLIDEDGFLREQIPDFNDEKYTVLTKLQSLQPAGVFSRNLIEFYTAYLISENMMNERWELLINNLHKVAVNETDELIEKLGGIYSYEALINDLKELPTTPDIPSALATHITPDLIVEKVGGDFKISLNSNIHSRVDINESYVSEVRAGNIKSADKKFITEKFSSAKWLKTAIIMRAENLINIGSSIIRHQSNFLNGGDLKPLTLKVVAGETDVHISTVSRIINNKYFLYNGATTELKQMFSNTAVGDISQKAIMDKIITMIENEKNTKIILSDEDIVSELSKFQINISRRTVAKYRKLCKIESSRTRATKKK